MHLLCHTFFGLERLCSVQTLDAYGRCTKNARLWSRACCVVDLLRYCKDCWGGTIPWTLLLTFDESRGLSLLFRLVVGIEPGGAAPRPK